MTEIETKACPVQSKIPTHSGDNIWVELMNAPRDLRPTGQEPFVLSLNPCKYVIQPC